MSRSRGTSNGNSSGSSYDRARRRAWLVDTFGWRLPDGAGVACCYLCAVPLLEHDDPEAPGQSITVDRIVPGCLGGRYVRGNIRPACAGCNSETGGRLAHRSRLTERARTGSVTQSSRVSRVAVTPPRTGSHGHSRVFANVQVRGSSSSHGTMAHPTPSRPHGPVTARGISAGQGSHGSITAVTHGGTHGFPPLPTGGNRVPGP